MLGMPIIDAYFFFYNCYIILIYNKIDTACKIVVVRSLCFPTN